MNELEKKIEEAEQLLNTAVRGRPDLMLLAQQNIAMWTIALELARLREALVGA